MKLITKISFENIHKTCKNSTPKQITQYTQSLQLFKTITNIHELCTTENVRLLNQIICTRRQTLFQIVRTNNYKIGRNTAANKFYPINGFIGLDTFNPSFVHYKKLLKIQFLKYGKMWFVWMNHWEWKSIITMIIVMRFRLYNWISEYRACIFDVMRNGNNSNQRAWAQAEWGS